MFAFFQDLMNLAPRKPDWDLKRDVSKKLAKLERRTQRAIAELISKFEYIVLTLQQSGDHEFLSAAAIMEHRTWSIKCHIFNSLFPER